jgi:hypothetical protein
MNMDELIITATLTTGILMLLASLWYFARKKSGYSRSIATTGIVTALKQSGSSVFVSTDSDDDLAFRQEENMFKGETLAPVIEFKTHDGITVTITGSASKPPRYKVGERVKLLYTPASPEKAIIDSFLDKWFLAVFFITFSSITVGVGGLLLFLHTRSMQ